MRVFIVVTLALVAAGCATKAETQYEQMVSGVQAAQEKVSHCRQNVTSQPYAKALSDVIWMPTDEEAPLSYSMNESRATDTQLEILDKFAQASLSCDRRLEQDISAVHPQLGLIVTQFIEAKRGIFLALLQRKISFGERHERFRELVGLMDKAWIQASLAITNQLAQEHEAELQARQMALQTFADAQMALAASQPAPASRQVPVYPERRLTKQTNCYATSTGMRCTTW